MAIENWAGSGRKMLGEVVHFFLIGHGGKDGSCHRQLARAFAIGKKSPIDTQRFCWRPGERPIVGDVSLL